MIKMLMAAGTVALLAACSSASVPMAHAAEVPTVMVAGEDWDEDAFERDNRVFNRVLDQLMAEFSENGFRVYDERAASLTLGLAQERTGRADVEVLDIARRLDSPPIDLVLLFQVYPEVQRLQYVTAVRARIRARLVQVHSGRFVDTFEATRDFSAPAACGKECLWEHIGDEASVIARDVSTWMSMRLAQQVFAGPVTTPPPAEPEAPPAPAAVAEPSPEEVVASAPERTPEAPPPVADASCTPYTKDYMLVFDGFAPQEMAEVEKYLVIFTGYCSHRPVESGLRRFRFAYESGISDAHLKRNLDRVLFDVFGAQGVVEIAGNEFTMRKMGQARSRPVLDR